MIDAERLAETFITLCEIDSPPKKEGRVAAYLKKIFSENFHDAEIFEDDSFSKTGSDANNLVFRFPGNTNMEPVFFNCHMDTVEPAIGVKVKRENDIFYSAGNTVLGSDDKAGIAILIETMRSIQQSKTPYGPVEFVFTTCEEVGLLGVKHFEYSLLKAKMGYALDSTGTDIVVIGAPAANHLHIEIKGLAAHAGLHPEQGISSIQLASQAVAKLPLGRLDHESTANIGLISGGNATNIIPEITKIEGEVRSHSAEKLAMYTQNVKNTFETVIKDWANSNTSLESWPSLSFEAIEEYPVLKLSSDDDVIKRIDEAAQRLGRKLEHVVAGGGSDANIFNGNGAKTAIIGIGMTNVHTTDEQISLNDMIYTAELIKSLITY